MSEFQIEPNREFQHLQISIKTHATDGIIASLHSEVDRRTLILSFRDGQVQVDYYASGNSTSQVIFNEYQPMDNVQQHDIQLRRLKPKSIAQHSLLLQIGKRHRHILITDRSPLFFDLLTIAGSPRLTADGPLLGCFSNITYNHQPPLPMESFKVDRSDCVYQQETICDRRSPCRNSPAQAMHFCGQSDCSLVCTSTPGHGSGKGSVRYLSQIGPGQYEQIYFTLFTTTGNATLLISHDDAVQVSIILQVDLSASPSCSSLSLLRL